MDKVSIIIPAHNEEKRIADTLKQYDSFFNNLQIKKQIKFEIVVVLNACKDNTLRVVKQNKTDNIRVLNFIQGGKGFAVIEGFKDALKRDNEVIGFVDADMATSPKEFYNLILNLENSDGVIASRYMRESVLNPPPVLKKRIGSRIFNFLLRSLFFVPYRDTQCGAKIFRRKTIEKLLPKLSMSQWAFDVEILYNAHKMGFFIKEVPTIWSEKEFSKVKYLKAGIGMALGIIRLRLLNSPFKGIVKFVHKTL